MKNLDKKLMRQSLKLTAYTLFLLLSLVAAASFIASPLLLNSLIQQEGEIAITNILLIIAIIALGHLISVSLIFVINKMIRDYYVKTILKIFSKVFMINYDKYIDDGPSALQEKANRFAGVYAGFYFTTVPNLMVSAIMITVLSVIAFTISPLVAAIMLITLPLNFFGFKLLNKRLSFLSMEMSRVCSESWANENALISQVDFIKQNSKNHNLIPKIENYRFQSEEITRKVNNTAGGFSTLIQAANQIISSIMVLILAYMMLNNVLHVGGAVLIMLIMPYFSNAVRNLNMVNLNMAELSAAKKFLSELSGNMQPSGNASINQISKIDFNIDKVVVKDKVLINNVKFSVQKGDIVGIMGESGSGKSSLAKLIAKFRNSNGILVDGIDISNIDNTSYLNLVSYFSQNSPIVTDTLLNNLNFGRDEVNKVAYTGLQFLDKFNNYDEVILENGANLSGGDKQRIALARYFTENAQVVILDEPTNSLDKTTEDEILSSVMEKRDNKIIFLISHTPENYNKCNVLFEIRDKKLVQIR